MRRSNIRVNADDTIKIDGVEYLVVKRIRESGYYLKEVDI